jgi:hypothetical protein
VKVIRFFIDPETEQPHIYGHDVTEAEVEQLFGNYPLTQIIRGSAAHRKPTRIATGQTDAGRYLKVIYSADEDGIGVFVITAYDLRGNELHAYRRKRRRRYL